MQKLLPNKVHGGMSPLASGLSGRTTFTGGPSGGSYKSRPLSDEPFTPVSVCLKPGLGRGLLVGSNLGLRVGSNG